MDYSSNQSLYSTKSSRLCQLGPFFISGFSDPEESTQQVQVRSKALGWLYTRVDKPQIETSDIIRVRKLID